MMCTVPWKCAGCGKEAPDRISNCDCPTGCLYRRVAGKSESAVKFEHAAHSRWPHLNPLEALLADALKNLLSDHDRLSFIDAACDAVVKAEGRR